jgi:hypothetical protein
LPASLGLSTRQALVAGTRLPDTEQLPSIFITQS